MKTKLKTILIITLAIVMIAQLVSCGKKRDYKTLIEPYEEGELTASVDDIDKKLDSLKTIMLEKTDESALSKLLSVKPEDGKYTVFISVSDALSPAKVVNANGKSISDAFDAAAKKCAEFVRSSKYPPVWVKADLVRESSVISLAELNNRISISKKDSFKYGISFDDKYERAFLCEEINCRFLIDSENKILSGQAINSYLESCGKTKLESAPLQVAVFKCSGFICDERGNSYQLCNEINSGYGRRLTDMPDPAYIKSILRSGSSYLADECQESGLFVYGYNGASYTVLEGYSPVRHAGTLWNMVRDYELIGGETLKSAIVRGIDYMIREYVVEIGGAGYFRNPENEQIALGGNALALLALSEYTRVFNDDKYIETARSLARGILSMHENAKTGAYNHVLLYPDLSVYKEFSTVYYDGEATFALSHFYGVDKDQKWLDAACEALDHFAANEYDQYSDHWMSYSCNEVTKYVQKAEYFELGIKNAYNKMEAELSLEAIHPTGFEMLTASFEMITRIEESGVKVNFPSGFKTSRLAEIIIDRADYDLCGFCYPEYVMYFNSPSKVLGAFFIRTDDFRIRIDDVQHMLGGYYNLYHIYDKVLEEAGK